MSRDAALPWPGGERARFPGGRLSPFERIRAARQILRDEAQAIVRLADTLDGEFSRAVEMVAECAGAVIVTGMGKAGNVGRKISATLRSTGTRSAFLHPAEAVHGDLGLLSDQDILLALSQSGETDEITRLLECARTQELPIIAITARSDSSLGAPRKLCWNWAGCARHVRWGWRRVPAPRRCWRSGMRWRSWRVKCAAFGARTLRSCIPAASLGRMLSDVDRHMRPWAECRVAPEELSARQVFVEVSRPGRRSGAIMLLDANGRLSGIFTDSDLARIFESKREGELDRPVRELMTASPKRIASGAPMHEAVALMAERKISELPVIDANGRPVGLLDITDIVGLFPEAAGKD